MALAPQELVLVTVIVKVTVLPLSPEAAVYVGVNEFAPAVILPAPLVTQLGVPLV